MRNIIAIDPGVGGGICSGIVGDLETLTLTAMPSTLVEMRDALEAFAQPCKSICEIWIEEIPKFTGQNRNESTTAVLFQNFGRLEGIASSMRIPIHRVSPKVWQAVLSLGVRGKTPHAQWKRKLKGKAAELYPSLDVTLKTADAILIWHFASGGGR